MLLIIFILVILTPTYALDKNSKDIGYIDWVYCPSSATVNGYVEFKVKVTCVSKKDPNKLWSVVLCVDYDGDGQGDYWPPSCQRIFIIKPGESKILSFNWTIPEWILDKIPPNQNGFYVYFDLWNNSEKGIHRIGWLGKTAPRFIKLTSTNPLLPSIVIVGVGAILAIGYVVKRKDKEEKREPEAR